MIEILAITSCVVMASAFILYNWQIFVGRSSPNATSWFIWSTMGLLSASSYLVMSNDLAKSAAIITDATLCISVFLFATWQKKFSRPVYFDYLIIFGAAVGGCFWLISGDAESANIFLQIVAVISFFPTINGLLRGHAHEEPYPWLLWATAYALNTVIVIINYDGNWRTLIMPIFVGVGMHATVGLLAIWNNKLLPPKGR